MTENPLVVVNGILINGTKCKANITVSKSVKSISDFAFYNCSNLKTVTIPKSVKTIGDNAFLSCHKNLTIKTPKGSAAAKYAKKNKIKVKYI